MLETVAGALITGVLTLVGVLISNGRSQAVTETKLEELTREVRSHNNYGERLISLEERVKNLEKGDDGR